MSVYNYFKNVLTCLVCATDCSLTRTTLIIADTAVVKLEPTSAVVADSIST